MFAVDLISGNLGKVQTVVWKARSQWFNLGLGLGIDQDTLKMLKRQYPDENDCFREMLSEWLKSVEPSWEELLAALSQPPVGYKQLAKKIAGKFNISIDSDDSDEGNSTSVSAAANMPSQSGPSTPAPFLATSTANLESPPSQPGPSTEPGMSVGMWMCMYIYMHACVCKCACMCLCVCARA